MRILNYLLIGSLMYGCAGTMPVAKYENGEPIPEQEIKNFEKKQRRLIHGISYGLLTGSLGFIIPIITIDEDEFAIGSAVGGASALVGGIVGYSIGIKKDRARAILDARDYKILKQDQKVKIEEEKEKLMKETEQMEAEKKKLEQQLKKKQEKEETPPNE